MRILAVLAAFLFLVSGQAGAWGHDGHRIVAELAQRQLNLAAQEKVTRLLAGEQDPTLAGIANWADALRDTDPERGKLTARWHYINFPHGDCSYQPARDCPNGDCVVAAIERSFLILADRTRPDVERSEALKFLVHFVADIHQPLHAGYADDKGGNDFQISYKDSPWNLHSVWDTLIIQQHGLDPLAYAGELSRQSPPPAAAPLLAAPPAADWALESCRIVQQDGIYPRRHKIYDRYLNGHRGLVEQRLRQAGSRLASMLNTALNTQISKNQAQSAD